jgi:hypothetical protein
MIDNNHVLINNILSNETYTISSIKYGRSIHETVTKVIDGVSCSPFMVNSSSIIEVTTPDDLQNMSNGYVYKLKNDIDLKDYEWNPYSFSGVLIGNGYKISNLTIVKDGIYFPIIGLFTSITGNFYDLELENVFVSINANTPVLTVGALSGEASSGSQSPW